MNLPDQQQLKALVAGDETAFEMLFRTFYQPLCNYAYTFLRDREEAEETVQSTFLSVWEKREGISIHTAVKPYLFAMVRNACLNVLKHQKVKQRHAVEHAALTPPEHDAIVDAMEGSELEVRVQEAINRLPEQCRLVFKLSRFEELKYAEIAEQLSISIKTVENHMGKALKLMREQLKDYLPSIILLLPGFFG